MITPEMGYKKLYNASIYLQNYKKIMLKTIPINR